MHSAIRIDSFPERRMMAIPPLPGGVEMAHIVDWSNIQFIFANFGAKIGKMALCFAGEFIGICEGTIE